MSDAFHCDAGLAPLQDALTHWLGVLRERIALPAVTVFLQRTNAGLLDDRGHCGGAFAPRQMTFRADPAHPAFEHGLRAPLLGSLTHEAHHILRWDGPGYGATLGEALISEGLAVAAVPFLWPDAREPWEYRGAIPNAALRAEAAQCWDAGYDHPRWFFGSRDLPNWSGYRLGHWLVSQSGPNPFDDADKPADKFRTFLTKDNV